jgi:hypothetical protein
MGTDNSAEAAPLSPDSKPAARLVQRPVRSRKTLSDYLTKIAQLGGYL